MHLSKFCPTYRHAGNVREYEGIWPALKLIPLMWGNFQSNHFIPPPENVGVESGN